MYLDINNYTFFDGIKEKEVNVSYDDWLSSTEFSVYSKSFVQVGTDIINLFQKNTKKIEDFYTKDKELFNQLNESLHYTVEEKDKNNYKIYHNKHRYDSYYYACEEINKKKYLIFYSLGGSRFVESITIYKVFISDKIFI